MDPDQVYELTKNALDYLASGHLQEAQEVLRDLLELSNPNP